MLPEITLDEFLAVQLHVGTILSAKPNKKARKPAYVLEIDFGKFGRKTSSAQLTGNYKTEELVGKQIVAVLNFPAKRIAGVKSEVLVLGAVCEDTGTVLLKTDKPVTNGSRIL
jgi:tRNA-binding protein